MSDTPTHEERARQVSESLHRWCKSQEVTMLDCGDNEVTVFDDPTGEVLFVWRDGLGYLDTAAEEVEIFEVPT